jgi:translocator assembly and maintenance protein 41
MVRLGEDRRGQADWVELRQIIGRPALTQSVKGLLTAGLIKSVRYSAAKVRKWLKGRKQKKT